MTATEEFILDWLKKAKHDLKSAQVLLAAEEELYDSICFHAQQLAEKAIKALFTAKNIEFPKTHNLLLLSNLLLDADIMKFNSDLEHLTKYAIEFRYPGEYVDPGKKEAEESIRVAAEIYELCRRKIGL